MIKQFATDGAGGFVPVGNTVGSLPAGYYTTWFDNGGNLHIDLIPDYESSDLIHFEDSSVSLLKNEFTKFWTLKDKYESRSESHKRGFLLWGPPGSGKSCILDILLSSFIADGGLVFDFDGSLPAAMPLINAIEPERRKMFIMEDFDNIVDYNEHEVLQLLDGLVPLKNTVVIATTNYPENIPPRFLNRPSRFDRIEFVGFPSLAHRLQYIEAKSEELTSVERHQLAEMTENFTFAHLKEAVLSVELYGHEIKAAVDRIRNMQTRTLHSEQYSLIPRDRFSEKNSPAETLRTLAKQLASEKRKSLQRSDHGIFEKDFEVDNDINRAPIAPPSCTAG